VVVACDKFKGSLTAREVNEHVAGLRQVLPKAAIRRVPVADGGDGTVAALASVGFTLVPVTVTGPAGEPVGAHLAVKDATTVVELADACGLARLPPGRLKPRTASGRGVGDVVATALDRGARTVVLGVGGSASTDAAAGMPRTPDDFVVAEQAVLRGGATPTRPTRLVLPVVAGGG
jgi:glycerate kinase